jgi:hypothetical protein
MTVFPQLGTGALSQFPVAKKRRLRTVVNRAADGTKVKLADPAGGGVEWRLSYRGLSDAELANLQQLFTTAEGSLNGFTFLDPTGNLLAWTEEMTNAVWQAGPLLALSGGVADALSGSKGWHAINPGGGPQSVMQTLNAPGGYTYCFSVYGRAAQPTTVTLLIGNQSANRAVGAGWSRLVFTAAGEATADSIAFGIQIPAGAAVDLFGPQVEAQLSASAYKTGTTGGVYEGARFQDDVFKFTTTDVNRHSATLNIFYADNL